MESVYFYCASPQSADMAAYHHLAICIAEGLKQLKIPFYSNIDYWRLSPDSDEFLFRYDPNVTPDDCSVVVVSLAWFLTGKQFPHELFKPGRKYITVYLDRQDGTRTFGWQPDFRKFDLILKTHFCRNARYPQNFKPWSFGFSNRILNALQSPPVFTERQRTLLVNFRNKKNAHTVRREVYKRFLPAMESVIDQDTRIDSLIDPPADPGNYLLWYQTGKRHYPNYYERLQKSAACACFGGYFVSPWPRDKGVGLSRLQQKAMAYFGLRSKHVVQWDSWRLWESLVAGCATFHLDFEKYGISLPVMPQNWVDYIGVDLDNINETVEHIHDEPEILEKIAFTGRQWTIKHYSPSNVAQRFLSWITS
ncbi:MAG: glycosyltransferase family 1 protein [Cyanobacteria bacterium P01_H01_bin.58]